MKERRKINNQTTYSAHFFLPDFVIPIEYYPVKRTKYEGAHFAAFSSLLPYAPF
jgi:hypothetical protein